MNAEILNTLTDKYDLSMSFTSIPVRNNDSFGEDAAHFQVTVKRGGHSITTEYSKGVGHVFEAARDLIKQRGMYNLGFGQQVRKVDIDEACNWYEGKRLTVFMNDVRQKLITIGKSKCSVSLDEVLWSLLMDSEYGDIGSFDDWCSDFGYDNDSIKASKIYDLCRDTGRDIQRMFSPAELTELSELFQDY